jgi:predicted esterase
MLFSNFKELQDRIQKLYQNGDYAGALELATSQAGSFPEQLPLLRYYQIAMTALDGRPQEAIASFEALLDTGFWYNEVLLRKSASLSSLQRLPEFEAQVERNQHNQAEDQSHLFPMLILRSQDRCQAGDSPCPLLVGLHAYASTAQASLNFWRAAASAEWLVAALQSSQPVWKDAYVWDDHEFAGQEIKKHMASIFHKYAIDPGQVVLAGHDQGAEIAIELSLKDSIQARGFIAIAPTGPLIEEPESFLNLLRERPQNDLCGYIIIGGEDDLIPRKGIRSLVKVLEKAGIPCELEEVPNAGHTFIPEYISSLFRALEFIQKE